MLLLGCCQPTSVLRKEVRHLIGLRVASGKAAVVPARPFLHINVAIYAARSVASFLDKPISGIFGCGSSRNRAIFAASNPGIFAITGNGGCAGLASLARRALTCAKLRRFVRGMVPAAQRVLRLFGNWAPHFGAGPFSWRLFAHADESATKTIFPCAPLCAGWRTILGPAIRRGAFFVASAKRFC